MLVCQQDSSWYSIYTCKHEQELHTHIYTSKPGTGNIFFLVQCCWLLVCSITVKRSVREEEDRLVAQPAATAAQLFTGLPPRAQPARVVRVFRAVKWTPDWENEPLVEVWCVPVDFTAGFPFLWGSEYVCFAVKDLWLGREPWAWGFVWQPICTFVVVGRKIFSVYFQKNNMWIYTLLWVTVICILLFVFVYCESSWTLVRGDVCQSNIYNFLIRLIWRANLGVKKFFAACEEKDTFVKQS